MRCLSIALAVLAATAIPAAAAELKRVPGRASANAVEPSAVPLGATSMSQQTINEPGPVGIVCGDGGSEQNSYYRRFYLSAEHGTATSASVSAVTIGIQDGYSLGIPELPVTVLLYTIPVWVASDTIPLQYLTPIGANTVTVNVPRLGGPQAVRIPVTGTVTDTTANELVVEWMNGIIPRVPGQDFFPANNTHPQSHPWFFRAPACLIGSWNPVIGNSGFGEDALLMVVEGAGLPVSLQQFSID